MPLKNGIALKPLNGHPVRIPGYGYNNGNYSSQLDLILKCDGFEKVYDISDCQVIDRYLTFAKEEYLA